jgi:hypothetical protein
VKAAVDAQRCDPAALRLLDKQRSRPLIGERRKTAAGVHPEQGGRNILYTGFCIERHLAGLDGVHAQQQAVDAVRPALVALARHDDIGDRADVSRAEPVP